MISITFTASLDKTTGAAATFEQKTFEKKLSTLSILEVLTMAGDADAAIIIEDDNTYRAEFPDGSQARIINIY